MSRRRRIKTRGKRNRNRLANLNKRLALAGIVPVGTITEAYKKLPRVVATTVDTFVEKPKKKKKQLLLKSRPPRPKI